MYIKNNSHQAKSGILRDNKKPKTVTKSLLFGLIVLNKRLIIINLEHKTVDPYGITLKYKTL